MNTVNNLINFIDLIDKKISFYLINFTNMGKNFILDNFFVFITHLSDFSCLWIFLSIYFLFTKKNKIIGLLIIITLIVSFFEVNLIKHIIQRPRPFVILHLNNILISAKPNISFPSGHAANIFSGTIILNYFFNNKKIIFLITAFLVSLSRIYLGVHFFSDILIGSLIGILNGFCVIYFYKKYKNKFNKKYN